MAANEGKLGALHELLAEVLANSLQEQVIPAEYDEEGNETAPEIRTPPSAAMVTAAIQFLKNNSITCAPSDDNAMGELAKAVQDRQSKREQRRKELLAKTTPDSLDFMDGLPVQ
jgi:hypothetical protein